MEQLLAIFKRLGEYDRAILCLLSSSYSLLRLWLCLLELTRILKDNNLRKHKETKCVQFADDTTTVIDGKGSAKHLIRLLSEFAKIFGLKINKEESQGLWIGKVIDCDKSPPGFLWSNKHIKALGVYFSYS